MPKKVNNTKKTKDSSKDKALTTRKKFLEFKERESINEEKKISRIFVNVLSLISILGFASIISENLFELDISILIEPLWLIIMGVGFIIESSPIKLCHQVRERLDEKNFNRITTLVIGVIAFVSGFLTIPAFSINHFIFSAMKGLISFVAIIFIMVETWIIRQ